MSKLGDIRVLFILVHWRWRVCALVTHFGRRVLIILIKINGPQRRPAHLGLVRLYPLVRIVVVVIFLVIIHL